MSELAVVGDSEFTMGFSLIGIRKIFEAETSDQLRQSFNKAMADTSIGVIVTNDKAMSRLEANQKRQVENSISPVIVVLSTNDLAQDSLRDRIKKAIGIDLWSK
ncbi:MAG: V-type ATP synthase subunit F [Nanoarchaeota archaeon]|nr:V-type ATP synthase subunit F [Nanoarchaeota archaeon]